MGLLAEYGVKIGQIIKRIDNFRYFFAIEGGLQYTRIQFITDANDTALFQVRPVKAIVQQRAS
jgi:hypothetical protein